MNQAILNLKIIIQILQFSNVPGYGNYEYLNPFEIRSQLTYFFEKKPRSLKKGLKQQSSNFKTVEFLCLCFAPQSTPPLFYLITSTSIKKRPPPNFLSVTTRVGGLIIPHPVYRLMRQFLFFLSCFFCLQACLTTGCIFFVSSVVFIRLICVMSVFNLFCFFCLYYNYLFVFASKQLSLCFCFSVCDFVCLTLFESKDKLTDSKLF